MTDILIATTNPGKQEAFRRLLEGLPVRARTPGELDIRLDIAETGTSFTENALLKARAFRDHAGITALADDSGLCVDALAGEPGVHSARFGGFEHSPTAQNLLLLQLLQGVPDEDRGAEFVCVIACAEPNGSEWTAEGRVRGVIADGLRGVHGFGYDPVFLLPDLGQTFAELTGAEKDRMSHRGIAMRQARYHFETGPTLLE
jgi:XTP/dITP diphosphohydrolase